VFFYFLKLVLNSGFNDGSKKVYETPPVSLNFVWVSSIRLQFGMQMP
jgi:hypothetical protein